MSVSSRISQDHEADLAKKLGGRRTRGSGNQFNNPMDGRHSRYSQTFAFAWDGKATRASGVTLTQDMWDKAVEQAHHERPMMAVRRYTDDRANRYDMDVVVISLDDMVEMLDHIDRLDALESALRAYLLEYDTPAPDLNLRHTLREALKELVA